MSDSLPTWQSLADATIDFAAGGDGDDGAGTRSHVAASLAVLEKAYNDYGADAVALAFNGGKDCTCLLPLVRAAARTAAGFEGTLATLYIQTRAPFPEVEAFIDGCVDQWDLSLETIGGSQRDALAAYLARRPEIKAIVLGNRSTDPYSADLDSFTPTDEGWPAVMRVHPVLEWDYGQVWSFLRGVGVPYCPLYDQGYTSLGDVGSTDPNPALAAGDGAFHPAHELADGSLERAGRASRKKQGASTSSDT